MQLSIVVVNYNTKELVLGCIESIKKSGFDGEFEVIVVDNASTDGSAQALSKLEEITLIKNSKNMGFAKANNRGIKISSGKYVLLLNSDTKLKKKTLNTLVNFAKKTQDAGVVGVKLLDVNGTPQPSVFNFPGVLNAFRGKHEPYVPKTDSPTEVDAVVGAAFLLTPRAREKVGLLDERYFMYFEDLDYCRRVKRASLKVYYLPSAEIIHYHGASGKNEVAPAFQWRRLIPSSKIYHGTLKHYLINFILWSGQKWRKL